MVNILKKWGFVLAHCWMHYVRLIVLPISLVAVTISCRGPLAANDDRELSLCGVSGDGTVRIYHVSVSLARSIALKQAIDLPDNASCPIWLTGNSKLGWLHGGVTSGYQRDIYLLDLDLGHVKRWFHVSGDDEIEDVTLVSGRPWALLVSSRDQSGECSQYSSEEQRWRCVYSQGDLYTVDEQGTISRLTRNQSPLCEATWRPGGRTVAFRHSNGCVRPAPLESWDILLVDTETRQIQSFDGNQGMTPRWSPDGKYLAFLKEEQSSEGILGLWPHILNLDSNQAIPAGSGPRNWELGDPVWSPNSRYLAWVTIRRDIGVSVFDRVSQNTKTFQNDKYPSFLIRWSPDGTSLVWKDDSAFYFGDVARSSMYSVPVGVDKVLDWSFNGETVAYIGSTNQDSNQAFMMSGDGRDVINLTDNLSLQDIRWLQVRWIR